VGVQGLPDATVLGAGSWDALYFHDAAHLDAGASALLATLGSRGTTTLCPRTPADPAAKPAPVPAVYWINQPRPVRSRLKTEEKRIYLNEDSMINSNKAIAGKPLEETPFAAVIDLYEVRHGGWGPVVQSLSPTPSPPSSHSFTRVSSIKHCRVGCRGHGQLAFVDPQVCPYPWVWCGWCVCRRVLQVSKSRGWDAADGVHYGDSLYNVAFQMFANAALGTCVWSLLGFLCVACQWLMCMD
jgi:hypothetical protein